MRRYGSYGFGLPAKRRGNAPVSVPPTLLPLSLSGNSVAENAPNGTIIGTIVGASPGSTVTMQGGSDARLTVSLSGGAWRLLTTGATIDYEAATSLLFGLVETLAGATGTPKTTAGLSVAVINQNDTNPSAFTFTDASGVPLGAVQTSNAVTIAGLGASDSATASISGDVSSQMQKNGGSWGTGSVSVVNGDMLAVRHTSAGINSTAVNTTLTVGTTSDTFTSTTAAGAGGYTVTLAPALSGIPQARQDWSIYGGEYSSAPTHYRYNLQRINPADGSVALTTTTTKPTASGNASELHGTYLDGDAYYGFAATVDVSFDGGATYPITTAAGVNPTYPTPVLLPWVIADPTVSYTSGYTPGTAPLLVDIAGVLIPSLRLLIKVEDATLATLKYFGEVAIPESARSSPFTLDLSGATDPVPVPDLPTLLATDIVSFQLATPDFQYTGAANNVVGSASEWVAISPTAATGRTKIRLQNTGTGNAFLPKLELMKGGINILGTTRDGNPFFGRCVRSNVDKAGWDANFQNTPPNCLGYPPFDGNTFIMFPNDYIELDLFTVDLTGGTLNIHSADPYAPLTSYTLTEYGPTGTLVNTITRTGLTYTANETKTEIL